MIEWYQTSYVILGLPAELSTGQVRLKKDKNSTVGEAVEYITLRHSLLTGLDMKTQRMDYLVLGRYECLQNSIDYVNNYPLNQHEYVLTPKKLLEWLTDFKNIVLFNGTTKIL